MASDNEEQPASPTADPPSPATETAAAPDAPELSTSGGDAPAAATDETHVIVWLRPTGDAPILKQQRVRVPRSDPFARVVAALRSKTRAPSVLAYVREAFVPPLDAAVGDLADAYGSHGGGRLTVNYALAPAWG